MRKQIPLILIVLCFSLLCGCDTATTNVTGVKPEDRFNPAMSPAQRQHMMNRGPKSAGG